MGKRGRPNKGLQPGQVPVPLKWRPRVRLIGLITGAIGGLGAVVLVQQYGVAPLTRALTAQGLFGAVLSGIVIPSVVFALVVVIHNRRLRKAMGSAPPGLARPGAATAVLVMLAIPVVAVLLFFGGTSAEVSGPCGGVLDGVDLATVDASAADAFEFDTGDTIRGYFFIDAEAIGGRIGISVAGSDVTIVDEPPDASDPGEPGDFSFEVVYEDVSWFATGLYEFWATIETSSGQDCEVRFMVDVEGNPLDTALGRAAAGAVAVGMAGVVISGTGAALEGAGSMRDLAAALSQIDTAAPPVIDPVVTVQPGDNLWDISEQALGEHLGRAPTEAEVADYWSSVVELNTPSLQSGDPSVISAGEQIELPPFAEPTLEPHVPMEPTVEPTLEPHAPMEPTVEPTLEPHAPMEPTVEPTLEPHAPMEPTVEPTLEPHAPMEPTVEPTLEPHAPMEPTVEPTLEPHAPMEPTLEPTVEPTLEPVEPAGAAVDGTASPVDPAAPAEPGAAGAAGSAAPVEPTAPPIDGPAAPVEPAVPGGAAGATPVDPATPPVEPTGAGAAGTAAPVDPVAPPMEPAAPPVEPAAPPVDPATPVEPAAPAAADAGGTEPPIGDGVATDDTPWWTDGLDTGDVGSTDGAGQVAGAGLTDGAAPTDGGGVSGAATGAEGGGVAPVARAGLAVGVAAALIPARYLLLSRSRRSDDPRLQQSVADWLGQLPLDEQTRAALDERAVNESAAAWFDQLAAAISDDMTRPPGAEVGEYPPRVDAAVSWLAVAESQTIGDDTWRAVTESSPYVRRVIDGRWRVGDRNEVVARWTWTNP